jgi:hypothetical protein
MYSKIKSLTFSSPMLPRHSSVADGMYASSFAIPVLSVNTFGTIGTTNAFNLQYHEIITHLMAQRAAVQQAVSKAVAANPLDTSYRQAGVRLAWEYEQAELAMGGKGTADWTAEQSKEILENGIPRGAEGHHMNNVADHPEAQGDPDNIRFAKTREEHLKMHDGDFRNKTEGDMIDRDKRLKDTNNRRVARNEVSGLAVAAVIGLGTGFTIGFMTALAEAGISPDNIRNAAAVGGKTGVETMGMSAVNHVITRSIGEIASAALVGFAKNLGLTVTDNIIKMLNMGTIGAISICVFSIYQFAKLKAMGYGTKECLLRVGNHAAFSFFVLAIAIAAQGLWGGEAGIIASTSIALIFLAYKLGMSIHEKQMVESIRIYTIEKTCPNFGGGSYGLS